MIVYDQDLYQIIRKNTALQKHVIGSLATRSHPTDSSVLLPITLDSFLGDLQLRH